MEAVCPSCIDIGYCDLPETTEKTEDLPCLCQKVELLKRI